MQTSNQSIGRTADFTKFALYFAKGNLASFSTNQTSAQGNSILLCVNSFSISVDQGWITQSLNF